MAGAQFRPPASCFSDPETQKECTAGAIPWGKWIGLLKKTKGGGRDSSEVESREPTFDFQHTPAAGNHLYPVPGNLISSFGFTVQRHTNIHIFKKMVLLTKD